MNKLDIQDLNIPYNLKKEELLEEQKFLREFSNVEIQEELTNINENIDNDR